MYDILSIGNATVDVILQSKAFKVHRDPNMITGHAQSFVSGTKINVEKMITGVGGGAINSATTFTRQGFRSAIVAQIGEDFGGQMIDEYITKEKIHAPFVIKSKKLETPYSTILLTESGERTVLAYRGSGGGVAIKNMLGQDIACGWYYITSLGGDIKALKAIILQAKQLHIRTACNPGGAEIEDAAFRKLIPEFDVLIINREEAETLLPRQARYGKGVLESFVSMRPGFTVITSGARGAAVTDGQKCYYVEAPDSAVIDRLGAGDAFGSGFIAGLMKYGGNLTVALQLAAANAGAVCEQYGANAGILHSHSKMPRVKVTEHKL